MRQGRSPFHFRAALVLALWGAAHFAAGCGGTVSEEELGRARATVERVIRSGSYEAFTACFTERNRDLMGDSPIWYQWWKKRLSRDRGNWEVIEVRSSGGGEAEVVIENRADRGRRQYYHVQKEKGAWLVKRIDS